jgi:hypothetical protein
VALFAHINLTHAAAITWDGGGSDGTCGGQAGDGNKWSCALNWSGDTLPTSADAVTFNGTSTKDATVDASFTGVITSLSINSGYTGTITLARSLNTTSTGVTSFTQAAGTFTATSQTLDIDGTFALSAGTFTASSTSTLIGGDFNVTGSPTFNHNSGTITFDGGTKALVCNNIVFNLIVFNATATKTVGSTCTLPLGSNPSVPNGLTVSGTLSGSGTITWTASATNTFNAGATLSGFTGLVSGGGLTISGATIDLGTYTTVDLNSSFTLSSGSFTAPSGTMTLATALTISGNPTFNANGGTITFDGAGATLSCNNVTFNLVTFNISSGTKTVNGNCLLPLGSNPIVTGAVSLVGTLSGSGLLTTTGLLTLNSSTAQNASATLTGFTALTTSALTAQLGTGGTQSIDFSGYNAVIVNGAFTLTSGTFTAPSSTMTISGALTISGTPTFNANGGTITVDGSVSRNWVCNGVTFNRINLSHNATFTIGSDCILPLGNNPSSQGVGTMTLNGTLSGTGILTLGGGLTMGSASTLSGFSGLVAGGTVTVGGNNLNLSNYTSVTLAGGLTMASGSFTAPSGLMTTKNFSITGGTFNHNNGNITIAGFGVMACNNVAFNRINLAPTDNTTITVGPTCNFPLGSNPTISGLLGRITVTGTLTGSGTLTGESKNSSSLTMSGNGQLLGLSGLVLHGQLTLQSGVILNLSDYNPVTIYAENVGTSITLQTGSSLIAPSGTMTLYDTFNNNAGNFVHNNGTVEFIVSDLGTDMNIQVADNTFYNLSVVGTSTNYNAFRFQFGHLQTILGNLSLTGIDSTKVLHVSSGTNGALTTGSMASIDPRGSRTVRYATIQDIANINATPISAGDGTVADWGNNTGFDFGSPYIVNVGPSNLVDGSTTYDTQPGFSFTLGKTPSSAKVCYRIELDDTADFSSPVVDYSFGLTTQGTHSFKVGQATNGGTYAAGSEGQSLTPGSYYLRLVAHDEAGNTSSWYTANSGKIAFVLGLHSDAFSIVSPKDKQTLTYARPYVRFHTATNANFPISSYKIVLNKVNALWGNPGEDTVWFDSIEPTKPDKGTTRTKEDAFISYDGDVISLYGRGSTQELTNGNYRLRVVAVDSYGTTAETTPTEFRIHLSSLSTEITEQTSGTGSENTTATDAVGTDSTANPSPTDASGTSSTTKLYSVKIKVVDTDKQPVSGATVVLHSTPRTGKTDKAGVVSFKDVEPGQHTVKVTYAGQSGEQPLTVASDIRTDTDINVTIKIETTSPLTSPVVRWSLAALGVVILGLIGYIYTSRRRGHRNPQGV